jgi:malonyl-CoA decarboxylase
MTERAGNRTSQFLHDLLGRVADVGRALSNSGTRAAEATPETLVRLCEDLLAGHGEATGLALARQILERFAALEPTEKTAFFSGLRARFGADGQALEAAVARWRETAEDDAARALHRAAEPRSQELLRVLNRAPGGTAGLVAMREDLIAAAKETPELAALDADFRHLFASWFNRGFLELRRIDWWTPAAILERIIRYEAVHAIDGWDDLRHRVSARDRRLYAFFHPALPDDPLIFVEVALTDEIPAAIRPVLARQREALDPRRATTAAFYSISNCQKGLRGISFGSFLIKQVVEELSVEFPALRSFVTLSPVPGLRAWAEATPETVAPARLAAFDAEPEAHADALRALAAHYLLTAKGPGGGAADPVARFHLGNGARLEQVHAGADPGERARRASWGVMVNYLYDLDDIERNHEAYANEGAIAASPAVRRLARAHPAQSG